MKPFEELATAAIDGVATPEERAALSTLIERDPAAKEKFHAMELAVRTLGRMPEVQPPSDLKAQIMAAVRAEGRPWPTTPAPVRHRASMGEVISRAMGLRLAATFAAGLAVGVIAFTLATGGRPLVQGPTSGTIAPPSKPTGIALAAGDAQAAVEMSAVADVVSIRITAQSAGPATVEVTWPNEVGFIGFESDIADSDRFHTRDGQATVLFAGPNFDGTLHLRSTEKPSELGIRLRRNRDVDEATLTAMRLTP